MPAASVVSMQGADASPAYLKEKSCLEQRLDETVRDTSTALDSDSSCGLFGVLSLQCLGKEFPSIGPCARFQLHSICFAKLRWDRHSSSLPRPAQCFHGLRAGAFLHCEHGRGSLHCL